MEPIIAASASRNASIMTDEWNTYQGLSKLFMHRAVKQGEDQYVDGDYHANNIKGFWSLLKRGVMDIYHSVSDKHHDKYVDELEYRYHT